MKACIIYDSGTGNTKKLADKIFSMFEITTIEKCEVVFIGSWTDKGAPTLRIQEELKKIKNKKVFYFGTCGFGGSNEYFEMLFSKVKLLIDKSNTILGYYYCQGKMPISVRKRYQTLLEKNPEDKKTEEMIQNFDQALPHPNQEDEKKLQQKIEESIVDEIDWTSAWAKKYPILATYQKENGIEKYAERMRKLHQEMIKEYELSNLDAFLVLKDMIYQEYCRMKK